MNRQLAFLLSHVTIFWFLLRAAPSTQVERGSAAF